MCADDFLMHLHATCKVALQRVYVPICVCVQARFCYAQTQQHVLRQKVLAGCVLARKLRLDVKRVAEQARTANHAEKQLHTQLQDAQVCIYVFVYMYVQMCMYMCVALLFRYDCSDQLKSYESCGRCEASMCVCVWFLTCSVCMHVFAFS